jgi:hypothetical protein
MKGEGCNCMYLKKWHEFSSIVKKLLQYLVLTVKVKSYNMERHEEGPKKPLFNNALDKI